MAAGGSSRPDSSEGISPELTSRIDLVRRKFNRLEGDVHLSAAHEAAGRIEAKMAQLPQDLKAVRRRGYQYSGQLEDTLAALKEQWEIAKPKVESLQRQHAARLKTELGRTRVAMTRAGRGKAADVASAESSVSGLEQSINAAERAIRSQYSSIESELNEAEETISRAQWLLDELEQSPEIDLLQQEHPVVAVRTEWHRDGDEGPEGVLFLTDQRLLFEQKEEVVTKRRFGIFKAESEMIHRLLLAIDVADISSLEDSEEGGFLGIGKADILEITCSGRAPVSRARFHLKGQNSSDWDSTIRRIQSGEIKNDLVAAYAMRIAEDQSTVKFPSQCPNCLANLPVPLRGATQVTCDFCGSAIGSTQT